MAVSFVAEDFVSHVAYAFSVAVVFDDEAALFEQLESLNEAVVQFYPVVFNHNLFDLGSEWESVRGPKFFYFNSRANLKQKVI